MNYYPLRKIIFVGFLFCLNNAFAQRIDLDLFGGISNYQGDLQPKFFTGQNANPGAAAILKYGVSDRLYIRAGFSFGSIAGNDAANKENLRFRNLNFRSGLQEFSAGLEYRIFSPEQHRFTPYIFVAAGIFKFKPYTFYGPNTVKTFLQPLGTEGQGLPEYPGTELYSLTQFCIPYGLGVKYQINCNLNIGFEFRQTKTFTDYLDDVSTEYPDQAALLSGRGQVAVDLSWRGDDLNGSPFPPAGTRRGNPGQGDWFYFAGITLGLKLNDCNTGLFSLGGLFNRGNNGKGSRIDCPKF
jgi:Domain of unknown function (DUF6089)